MADDKLEVQISADISELKKALQEATKVTLQSSKDMQKAIEEFSKHGQKQTSAFEAAWATMTGFIGGQVVTSAFNKLVDGFQAVAGKIGEGINDAAEAQATYSRLTFALSASGQNASQAAKEFKEFADRIQQTTAYDDDLVMSTGTLIQSLGNLKSGALQPATQAALDLAAATGKDLNQAAMAIAKAANGSTDALKKMGIVVQEGTTKSETFARVLDQVNARFGGAAAAQVNTYAGAIAQLKNNFGDIFQSIGKTIISNQALVNIINETSKIFNEASGSIDGNKSALAAFIDSTIKGSLIIVQAFNFAGNAVHDFVNLLVQSFDFARDLIQGTIDAFLSFGGGISGTMDDLKKNWSAAWEEMKSDILEEDSFDKIQNGIDRIQQSAEQGYGKMAEVADDASDGNKKVAASMEEYITVAQRAKKADEEFIEQLLNSAASKQEMYATDSELLNAKYEADLAANENSIAAQMEIDAAYNAQRLAMQEEKQANEQALLDKAYAGKSKSDADYLAAKAALDKKQNIEDMKLKAQIDANEKARRQQQIDATVSTLSFISSMQNAKTKELAAIGKAAAIANATWSTYQAANNAMANIPPPFNIAAAAATVAAGLVNVSKIAGTNLATGIDSVPGVGNRDNFPAVLMPGERVVPTETNLDLKEFLANQSQGVQNVKVEISLNENIMDFIETKLVERGRLVTSGM